MSLISKLKGDKVVWYVVLALSFFSSAFILALSILKKRRRDKKLAEKE